MTKPRPKKALGAQLRVRIAVLSPPIARPSLDAGAIRQVLNEWSFPPMPVHAVMTSRLAPARTRAFVDFLASRLIVL